MTLHWGVTRYGYILSSRLTPNVKYSNMCFTIWNVLKLVLAAVGGGGGFGTLFTLCEKYNSVAEYMQYEYVH